MYSLLNSDTYSNDQNLSVLKFRINPRPQKQANEKKRKNKFKSSKTANVTHRTNLSDMPPAC